ncbi:MAG: hypothetical protein E7614_04085 [Ruminococcaceae bacterium]|nr:hypothetical protein [Oscillospiraceae bacterium]
MRKKAVLSLIFTIFAFVMLIIPNERIAVSISDSLAFCGKTVIPQLFLYVCLSSVLWELKIVDKIVSAFPRYGAEISAFTVGLLSGFPAGALIAGNLQSEKIITDKRAQYLMLFSNNAGISFIFGFVASSVGKKGAFSLFLCQILSSLFFAFFFRKFLSGEDKKTFVSGPKSLDSSFLINGIRNATVNMINICGYIVFFSVFSAVFLSDAPVFIKGMVELTSGINSLFPLDFEKRLFYSGLFLGFGGICVHFQIFSLCNVKMRKFFVSKLAQGLFSAFAVVPVHNLLSKF